MDDRIFAMVVAFMTCVAVMPLAIRFSRAVGAVDVPGRRSSHFVETPRLGGAAVMIGAVAGISVSVMKGQTDVTLFLLPLGLGALGLVEDLRGLSVVVRLPLQISMALVALPLFIEGLTGVFTWRVVFTIGALIWLVSYINAFNFMDGINGISVAQAMIASMAYAGIGLSQQMTALTVGSLVIAGAVAGFAPFNFPTARSFLGDVGSYLIGGWIAILLLVGIRGDLPPESMIAPVSLYLVDSGWTLVRRARAGEKLFEPHRQHVYQRLVQSGWSHARTTAVVALLITWMSLLGLLGFSETLAVRVSAIVAIASLCLLYVRLPDLMSRSSVHRA